MSTIFREKNRKIPFNGVLRLYHGKIKNNWKKIKKVVAKFGFLCYIITRAAGVLELADRQD